ncbi:MAG: ubiquinone/menaquinone biosynthesis C-methylase UbiE [Granulosicoccus sp.]|jgi:ubiquinone/menaquinone biosynthesis C-methylase UbiE
MVDGAFNQMAVDYDDVFTNSRIGELQREKVSQYINQNIQLGKNIRVLELNCGTGEDALRFAQEGCKTTATDISSEMLNVARNKAEKADFSSLIEFEILDIEAIQEHKLEHKYDLVFSNFGGLNCVTQSGLAKLSTAMKSILNPNGRFVAVVMPDKCLMESIYFVLKLQLGKAFRRGNKKVEWINDTGESVMIYYYSPKEFQSVFEEVFSLEAKLPVGLWIPPSYTEQFFQRYPCILAFLSRLENTCSPSFTSRISDHYLIDLKIKNG